MFYIGLFLYIYERFKRNQNKNTMKKVINTLEAIDRETVLKFAAGLSGLAVAAFSLFIIITRL